ncbi:hypothetical protein GGF31_006820 [Allomyces arbusculus]|nr:hypothetical protein GGF31_006820 [Allomyces arbusculus]
MMMAAATDKRASVDDFGPFAAPPPPSMRGAARTNPATTSQPASRFARNDAAAPATVLPPMLTRTTLLSPADVLQLMGALDASAVNDTTTRTAPRATATTTPPPGATRLPVTLPCQALPTHAVNPAAAGAEHQRDPLGGHHRGPVLPPPVVSKATLAAASLPTPCPAAAVMPPLVATTPAATPMLPPPLLPSPASTSPAGSPAPVPASVHAVPSTSSAAPTLIDLSLELSPSAPPVAVLVPVARTRTSPVPQNAVVSPAAVAIQAAAAAPVPSVSAALQAVEPVPTAPAVPSTSVAPVPPAPTADTTQYPHDELHEDDAADALGHALAVSADTAHVPIPLAVDGHLVLALQLSNDYIDMYSRAARTARRAVPPADLVVVVDEDDGVLVVKCAAARPRARMAAFLSMALQALLATTPAARAQAGSPNGSVRAPSVRSPTTTVPPRARSIAASVKSARSVASTRSDAPAAAKAEADDDSDSDDDNVPLHRAALLPAAPLSAPPARLPGIAPRPVPATAAGAPRAQSLIMPRAPPAAASAAAPAPPMTWPRQGATDADGVRRRTSALQLPVLPAQLLEHWPPYRDGASGSGSGLPSPAPPVGAGPALPKPILMIPEGEDDNDSSVLRGAPCALPSATGWSGGAVGSTAAGGGARVAAFPPPPPAPTVAKGMAASPTRDSGVWGESAARLGL